MLRRTHSNHVPLWYPRTVPIGGGTKRVKWDGQPDERLRAMLLVKVHPSLVRLIAPEARIWMGKNWARWTNDKPDWFTDRWKRGLPDSVLSQQALAPLEYSVVTLRARVPSEGTATALLLHRPRSMHEACSPRHTARSKQSQPIRPSSAARANAVGKKGARTVLQAW